MPPLICCMIWKVVFQFNTNDARVRSIRSDKSPDSSSLNRNKKYSDHKSRDRSRNVSPRSHSPDFSSRSWDGRRLDGRSSRSDKQYSYKYASRNSDYKSPDRYESRGSSVSPNRSSELDRKVRERQLWSPTSSPGRGRDRDKRSRQSLSPRDDRGGGEALIPALPVAVVAIMLKSVHPDLRNPLVILVVKQVIL